MKLHKKTILATSMAVLLLESIPGVAQQHGPADASKGKENRKVERSFAFERLVLVDSAGVTGADGVISFPLSKRVSLFMMGDSFLTKVQDGKRDPNSPMINNTFILVNKSKNNHTALYAGTEDQPESFLIPPHTNRDEYYWPGHGFASKGLLHLFMTRFEHIEEGWGFQFTGTDYVRMKKDGFQVLDTHDFPYSNKNGVHYGHSILKDTDHVYIYGSRYTGEGSELHVARARLDRKDLALKDYTIYNGREWVVDPGESKGLKGIGKMVPEQFSVFRHRDLYILLMMERNLTTGDIYSYISDSPVGPWRNEKKLYHTTEQETGREDKVFTYNAMAHPQYMDDNRLLVSYCVNSFDIPKIHEQVGYYRPRFLWIPMEMILEP